ncbi:MAG TPA: metal-dependent transcriptional regulator, partial [Abditibacteriaceae bacterium]
MISHAAEDYLKTIYKLRTADSLEPGGAQAVTTQALAVRLGVSSPSATAMVKKLASLSLVRHTPYYGVELTEAGEKIALEIIRHHRLVETYLTQILGVEWDKVHAEAERWEHILSDEVEARMDAALGNPTRDPHGAPIPTRDGQIARDIWDNLQTFSAGSHL